MDAANKDRIKAIIKTLYEAGVPVTCNPDEIDSDISPAFYQVLKKALKYLTNEKKELSKALHDTSRELRDYIDHLSMVRRLGDSIDISSGLTELYRIILEVIVDEIGAENASIMILNKNTDELEPVAGYSRQPSTKNAKKIRFKVGDGVAGLAVSMRQPLIVKDASSDKRFRQSPECEVEIGSMLAIPFPSKGEPIGVINASHPSKWIFNQEQERILSVLANQIAVAVKNAQLVEQLLASNESLSVKETLLSGKIAELTRVNQEIEQMRFLNESIIENVHNGICLISNSGEIITWNTWLEITCGIKSEMAIGRKMTSVFMEHCTLDISPVLNESLAMLDKTLRRRFMISTAKGNRFVEFTFIPIQADHRGEQIIIVVNDVSQQVKTDSERLDFIKQLKISNQRLEELNQVKSEFVSMASHELRRPLTVLNGYLHLFEDGRYGELSKEQEEKLHIMADKVLDLTKLTEELLDLSLIETGIIHINQQPFDLVNMIRGLVRDYKFLGLKIEFHEPGVEHLHYDGDEERLKQVIINLIDNASKFSPPDKPVHISIEMTENMMELKISDWGVGIDDKEKKKVFKKFYQSIAARKSNKGTGLGLAIAREIIERHEGQIWVEDNEPQGTVMRIQLPHQHTEIDQISREVKPEADRAVSYAGKKVLLIESDSRILKDHNKLLTKLGFTVTIARDGIEAIDEGLSNTFDLILLDVVILRLSGLHVCLILQEEEINKTTPIIVVSAVDLEELEAEMIKRGCPVAAYLQKPSRPDDLLKKIQMVLG